MRVILFNLLPYRQIRLQRQRKRFWIQTAAVLLISVFFSFLISNDLSERLTLKGDLLAQIENIEQQIKDQAARSRALKEERDDLNRRIQTLESVDGKSNRHSQLFSILDTSRPVTVSLVSLSLEKDELKLIGLTASLSELSRWVNDLKNEKSLFGQISIVEVRSMSDSVTDVSAKPDGETALNAANLHEFELKLDLVPLLNVPVKEAENGQS